MKRVLIISHNSLNSNTNNGRTLIEYFNNYDKDNIAQLYLHAGKPNADFCNKYYEITDFDVIKSFYKFSSPGKSFKSDEITIHEEKENAIESKIYNEGSKKKSFHVFVRNLIWSFNTWFSKPLKKWLRDFNPNVIVFYGGDSVFSYRIANKISKFLSIPIIGLFGDDYCLNNKLYNKTIFGKINNHIYKKTFKNFIQSNKYICIDELMLEDYKKEIGGEGYCIYNSTNLTPFKDKTYAKPLKMSYLGNISINRYKSLIEIAKVISKNKLPIELNVYTSEKREWILNNILNVEGLNYRGEVSYDEVSRIMEDSDFIIHVEDFGEDSKLAVKYSFSTKIADSLACGRCLLAFGPAEIATMQYLKNNNCALVATSTLELEDALINKINKKDIVENIISNAKKIVSQNHNEKKNHIKIGEIIESL